MAGLQRRLKKIAPFKTKPAWPVLQLRVFFGTLVRVWISVTGLLRETACAARFKVGLAASSRPGPWSVLFFLVGAAAVICNDSAVVGFRPFLTSPPRSQKRKKEGLASERASLHEPDPQPGQGRERGFRLAEEGPNEN